VQYLISAGGFLSGFADISVIYSGVTATDAADATDDASGCAASGE